MKNSRKTNVKSNTSDIEAKEKKEQQEQEKILAAKYLIELIRSVLEERKPKPKPELPQALNEDVKAVAKDFRMIINEASPMLRTYLKKARLSAGEGNRLLIVLPDELSASAVATPEHKEEIQSLIEQKIGKKVEIDVRQMEAGRRFEDNFVDLENLINMEITVEDE